MAHNVTEERKKRALVHVAFSTSRLNRHKLLVYGERQGSFLQKSQKDLWQAAALLLFFKEHRAWEVEEAWADLMRRGRGWETRAKQGLAALAKAAPELDASKWLALPKRPARAQRQ